MHFDLLSLPLAFLSFDPRIIGLLIPICGLIFVAVLAISGMYFKNRQREQWHQTARLALEKGQAMPPFPASDDDFKTHPPAAMNFTEWREARRADRRRNELKGGLILVAVGLALFLALGGPVGRLGGGIAGGIGLALLLSMVLDGVFSPRVAASDRRQPSP